MRAALRPGVPRLLVESTQRPDQNQDRDRHADKPKQEITSHLVLHSGSPKQRRRGTLVPCGGRPAFMRVSLSTPAACRCRSGDVLIQVHSRGRTRGRPVRRGGQGMEIFLQQLINGITLGSIYGLIAIGYTMVFGIIGMVNFAHGDVFMVSSFIALVAFLILTAWLSIGSVVLALMIVLVVAMVLTSLVNWTIERVAYRPLRGSFRLAPLISAIGMSIFLSNFVQVAQGPRTKSIPPMFNDIIVVMSRNGYDVTVSYKQIAIWVVTAVLLVAFWYLVTKTALGRAQRSCEQDHKMASLVGIDVDRTISVTFVIAAALAAVAGTLYLTYYGVVRFDDGFVPGVKAFTAAVLGGIGSLPGAVLGGLLIGIIETLWGQYVSSDYKDVAAFSILAIVMIFLPQGILGRPDVEKV